MCVVSAVLDNYRETAPVRWPQFDFPAVNLDFATRKEVEELRAEVKELKRLLKHAQRFDERTGQPECETDDKVKFVKQVADAVGVDLGDL